MTNAQPRSVLLTGASGFLGGRCIAPLLSAGFEVHAVSRHDTPSAAGVRWHRADLMDADDVARLLDSARTTHLLHCAWIATPGLFWSSPENIAWLRASAALAEGFFERGGERAVGVGTGAEYQWGGEECREEVTSLHPDSLYGRCKLQAGIELAAVAAARKATAAWARVFFPYGPGEPRERLIPSVIASLLQGQAVACTHGHQVRDFIYIDDVAAALVALLRSPADGTYNVGCGMGLSLRDVVSVITAKLGRQELVHFGARETPPGDPARVVADTTRIRSVTGWKPRVGIEEGIERSIQAWRARLNA